MVTVFSSLISETHGEVIGVVDPPRGGLRNPQLVCVFA